MSGGEWAFTSSIAHPDGTEVLVTLTVAGSVADDWRHRLAHTEGPGRRHDEPVLECSELTQMGAVRAMGAYVATKTANESRVVPF